MDFMFTQEPPLVPPDNPMFIFQARWRLSPNDKLTQYLNPCTMVCIRYVRDAIVKRDARKVYATEIDNSLQQKKLPYVYVPLFLSGQSDLTAGRAASETSTTSSRFRASFAAKSSARAAS